MSSFNLNELNLEIGALTRAITDCRNKKDRKILLNLQRKLMQMEASIKNPKI